jgi:predicted anti-sigma-YlaC factor YlaD
MGDALFYRLYYRCDRIRDFAYDYLEGKLPLVVSARFHMHLRGCPQCQEYMVLYRLAASGRPAAEAAEFRRDNPPPQEFLDETLSFLEKHGIVPPPDDEDPEDKPK